MSIALNQFEEIFKEQKGISVRLLFYIEEFIACRKFVDDLSDTNADFWKKEFGEFIYSYLNLLVNEYYRLIGILFKEGRNSHYSIINLLNKAKEIFVNEIIDSTYKLYLSEKNYLNNCIAIRDQHIAHIDTDRFSYRDNIVLKINELNKVKEIIYSFLGCEELFTGNPTKLVKEEGNDLMLAPRSPSLIRIINYFKRQE